VSGPPHDPEVIADGAAALRDHGVAVRSWDTLGAGLDVLV
jgi:hypothetical protein